MTTANSGVVRAEQRAWNYWFVDGQPSLVSGVACVLVATSLLSAAARPRHTVLAVTSIVSLILYVFLLIRLRNVVEWLKERITYPRTGYVAPPNFTEDQTLPVHFTTLALRDADERRLKEVERIHQDRKRLMWMIIAMAAVAAAAAWFIESRWICLVVGCGVGAALWVATRENQRISWIEITAMPLVGFYAFLVPVHRQDRLLTFVAGGGIALIISGTVSLIRYLRQNPVGRG